MKKIYMKPETQLTEIELQQLMSLSTTEESATKNGEVLSRESGWDDEY